MLLTILLLFYYFITDRLILLTVHTYSPGDSEKSICVRNHNKLIDTFYLKHRSFLINKILARFESFFKKDLLAQARSQEFLRAREVSEN